MAKKWNEVTQSEAYQGLHEDDQHQAKQQYFNSVVTPQVSEDEVGAAKSQFFAYDPSDDGMQNSEYDELITDTAIELDIPAKLFHKQLRQESGLDPTVTSKAGAVGIGQFMPATAKEMGITDRTNPTQSIKGAGKYLKKMYKRYGNDWDLALAAYNAGPGVTDKVLRGKRKWKPETVGYLKNIRGVEDINKYKEDRGYKLIEDDNAHLNAYYDNEIKKAQLEYIDINLGREEIASAFTHGSEYRIIDKNWYKVAGDGLTHGTFGLAESIGTTLDYAGGKIASMPGSLEDLPEEYSMQVFGMLSPIEQMAVGKVMDDKDMTLGKAINTVLEQERPELRKEYAKIGKAVSGVGKITEKFWGDKAKEFGPPPSLEGKNLWDDTGDLFWNPSYWVYNLADMIPALAATLIPAVGAGKVIMVGGNAMNLTPQLITRMARIGQMAVGGTSGGGLEASQTFKDVLKKTGDRKEAEMAAQMMFMFVAGLSAISTDKLLKVGGQGFMNKAKKGAMNFFTEGLTEGLEEPAEVFSKISAKILQGKPVPADVKEMYYQSLKDALTVFPIAGITGGGVAIFSKSEESQEDFERKQEETTEELRKQLTDKIAADPELTPEQQEVLIKKANEELGGRDMAATPEEGMESEEKKYQEEILDKKKQLTPEELAELPQAELEKIPVEERARIMLGEEATQSEVLQLVNSIKKTQAELKPKEPIKKEVIKPEKFTPKKKIETQAKVEKAPEKHTVKDIKKLGRKKLDEILAFYNTKDPEDFNTYQLARFKAAVAAKEKLKPKLLPAKKEAIVPEVVSDEETGEKFLKEDFEEVPDRKDYPQYKFKYDPDKHKGEAYRDVSKDDLKSLYIEQDKEGDMGTGDWFIGGINERESGGEEYRDLGPWKSPQEAVAHIQEGGLNDRPLGPPDKVPTAYAKKGGQTKLTDKQKVIAQVKDKSKKTTPDIVTNTAGEKVAAAYKDTVLTPVPKTQQVEADGTGLFFEREGRYKDTVNKFKSTAANDITKAEQRVVEEAEQLERELAAGTSKYQWFLDEVIKSYPKSIGLIMGTPSQDQWNEDFSISPGDKSDTFLRGTSRTLKDTMGAAVSNRVFVNPQAIAFTGASLEGVFIHELLHSIIKTKIGMRLSSNKHALYSSAIQKVLLTIPPEDLKRFRDMKARFWDKNDWDSMSKTEKYKVQSFAAFMNALDRSTVASLPNYEEVLVQAFASPYVMAELYQIVSAKGGLRSTKHPNSIARRLVKIAMDIAGLGQYRTGAKQKIADDLIDVHNEHMEGIIKNEQKYANIPHGSIWEDHSVLDLRPFKAEFPKGSSVLAPAIKEKGGNVWFSRIAHFDITDYKGDPRIGEEGFVALDKTGRKILGFYSREEAGVRVDPDKKVIDPDSGAMASEDVPWIQLQEEEKSDVGDKPVFKRDKNGDIKPVTGQVSTEQVKQKKKRSAEDIAAIAEFKNKYRKQDDAGSTQRQIWTERREEINAMNKALRRESEKPAVESTRYKDWKPEMGLAHMTEYALEMERDRVMDQLASKYSFMAKEHPGRRYYEQRLGLIDILFRQMARKTVAKQKATEAALETQEGGTKKANLRFYTGEYKKARRVNAPVDTVDFIRGKLVNLMGRDEFYKWSGEEAPIIKRRKAKEQEKELGSLQEQLESGNAGTWYRGQRDTDLETKDIGIHLASTETIANKYFVTKKGDVLKKLRLKGPMKTLRMVDAGVGWDNAKSLKDYIQASIGKYGAANDKKLNKILSTLNKKLENVKTIADDQLGDWLAGVAEDVFRENNIDVVLYRNRAEKAAEVADEKNMAIMVLDPANLEDASLPKVTKVPEFTEEDAKKQGTKLKGAKSKQEARDIFDKLEITVDDMISDKSEASDEFLDMATNAMQQALKMEAADATEIQSMAKKLATLITETDESYESDSNDVGVPNPTQMKFNKWSPVKVKFDAYYAPEDGFVPSGYSFSVVDKKSVAYGASYSVASLDKKSVQDAVKFLEDQRAGMIEEDQDGWEMTKDREKTTSREKTFPNGDILDIDFDHGRLSSMMHRSIMTPDVKNSAKIGQPYTSIVWTLNGSFDRSASPSQETGSAVIFEIRRMIRDQQAGKYKAKPTSAFVFSGVFGDDVKNKNYVKWVKRIADTFGWEFYTTEENMYAWDGTYEPTEQEIKDAESKWATLESDDGPQGDIRSPAYLEENKQDIRSATTQALYQFGSIDPPNRRTDINFEDNIVYADIRDPVTKVYDGLKITLNNAGVINIHGLAEPGTYHLIKTIDKATLTTENRFSIIAETVREIADRIQLQSETTFVSDTVQQQRRIDMAKVYIAGAFHSAGNALRLGDQEGPIVKAMPNGILYYNVDDGGEYDKIMFTKTTATNSLEISVHHPHYDEWMRVTEISFERTAPDFNEKLNEAYTKINDGLIHEDSFQAEPEGELASVTPFMTLDETRDRLRDIWEEDEDNLKEHKMKDPVMESDAKQWEDGFADDAWYEKLWSGISDAMKGIREFKYLKREEFGDVQFALRQLKKGKAAAARGAVKLLKNVLKGLNSVQYHNVQRLAYLMDLREQVEMNEKLDAAGEDRTVLANPFGWSDAKIKEETARVWDMVRTDPRSKLAWLMRQQAWFEIRKTYSEAMESVGFDVTNKIRRPHYFRHQVYDYMMGEHKRTHIQGSGRLAIPTSRSHLKHRAATTGYKMNLNLIQADFEIMTQLLYDTQVALVLEEVMERYGSETKLDGYDAFNPREGAVFHMVNTIPGKFLEEALAKGTKEINIPRSKIKQVLALGGKYKGMFLPEQLANTLNEALEQRPTPTWQKVLFKTPMRMWKAWQLISPWRILKYNVRNMTGDAEAVFLGSPMVFKHAPRAVADLWNWKMKDKISKPMQEWIDRGGQETTLQAQEFFEILQRPEFAHLKTKEKKLAAILKQKVKKVVAFPRAITDFREMILRYAAYLKFKNELDRSKTNKPKKYVASLHEEVDALRDNGDKAFMMSNDLLGAYDRVSQAGEGIRSFIAPFWSFQEVNLKRTATMFKNHAIQDDSIAYQVGKRMGVGGAVGAIKVGKLAMKLMLFSVIVGLWNNLKYGDEEDGLPEEMRERSHIILPGSGGKSPNIYYFPRIGVVGDLLEWAGMDTMPNDITQLILHPERKTWDRIIERHNNGVTNFEDITNKVVQMVGPQYKMPIELLMGEKVFPSIWNRQPITDRWKWMFDNFQLGAYYDKLAGKPTRRDWLKRSVTTAAIYHDDKKRLGWLAIQQQLADYRRRAGLKGRGFIVTDSGSALYNMGLAWRYGDRQAYVKYLAEYVKITVDKFGEVDIHKRMVDQWEKLNPLEGLIDTHQAIFYASLNEKDKKALKLALQYYLEIKAGVQFLEGGKDDWIEQQKKK